MKMKKNTALISTDRLQDLILQEASLRKIKAKEEIPKSKTIIVEEDSGYRYEVKTDDECNLKLATDLKYAKQKIIELKDKADRLTSELHCTEEIIRAVKKMNYFTFRKWKKDA